MSLLRIESADLEVYPGSKWQSTTSALSGYTVDGEKCWGMADSADLSYYFADSEKSSTVIVGMRLRTTYSVGQNFIQIYGNGGSVEHMRLDGDNNQGFAVERGDNTTLATGGVFPDTKWMYVEFKVTISNFVGAFEVRVNGKTIMSDTNVDTKNGGTSELVDRVRFSAINASGYAVRYYARDFVIMNNLGGAPYNDFIGPVRIEALNADGAGNYSAWTPNTGTNWQAVDEADADDDTTYVEASSTGLRDSYTFANTTLGSVDAVQVFATGRYNTAPLGVAPFLRRSSIDNDGSRDIPPAAYGSLAPKIWETDPIAGGAWTATNFNATEFGLLSST